MADEKKNEEEKQHVRERKTDTDSSKQNAQNEDTVKTTRKEDEEQSSSTRNVKSDDNGKDAEGEEDFDSLFVSFATFGDRTDEEITLRCVDKWFEQANVFDSNLTTTDTGITFAKVAKRKKKISKKEFEEFLEQLASDKGMEAEEIKGKLSSCGPPSFTGATKPVGGQAAEIVRRLTDTSGYTGTHKERFDEEGKGKGLSGRYDTADNDGYVTGYRRSSEGKK